MGYIQIMLLDLVMHIILRKKKFYKKINTHYLKFYSYVLAMCVHTLRS